jgi:DNA repair exonuclease SbcCD ATPase subunit
MIEAREGYPPELIMEDFSQARAQKEWEADQSDAAEIPAYYQRRSAGVWACLAILTVALGVALAYGYSVLQRQGIQLEQIPGLAKSLPPLSQHLVNVENRLADSRAAEHLLAAHIQSIDTESKAAILETRHETSRVAFQMQQALARQINQQTAALQAQISHLTADRANDRASIAQFEEQIAEQRSELDAARADYTRELAILQDQQTTEHRELAALSSSLPTRTVTFEVQKDQPVEIAPGLTFRLTKTDLGRQRFDGWIESTREHQRVSVQSQSLRTPVVFFPSENGKALLLIVTQMHDGGVSGYLLMPSMTDVGKNPAAVSAADNSPGAGANLP